MEPEEYRTSRAGKRGMAGGLLTGAGIAGGAAWLMNGGTITPEMVERWSHVLRVDPLVLLVGVLFIREARRMHSEQLAMIRSLRDEVMIASGRLWPRGTSRNPRQRGDGPPE